MVTVKTDVASASEKGPVLLAGDAQFPCVFVGRALHSARQVLEAAARADFQAEVPRHENILTSGGNRSIR